MKVTRLRKGIKQTYEYNGKKTNYCDIINLRIDKETKIKIQSLARTLGYKSYTKMIRDILDSELEKYDFVEDTQMQYIEPTYLVFKKGE